MRKYLSVLFLLLSLTAFGQLKFLPKDTIKNFTLKYVQSGGGRDSYFSININSKGKITVINKGSGSEVLGKKKISLDANTFRQFKNILVSDCKVYSLKDTLDHNRVYDATSDVLTISSDLGEKKIYGCGREHYDPAYEYVLREIMELVGKTIGNSNDLK